MSFFCSLFGHKIPMGWNGGVPYMESRFLAVDGLNTEHASIIYKCARCRQEQTVAKIHVNPRLAEVHLRERFERSVQEVKNAALESAAQKCEQRACSLTTKGSPAAAARQCRLDILSLKA